MSEKIVCVGLDGVLAKFDKWEGVEKFGPVIPGARFFLEELQREGFKIIIHTVRCSPEVNPPPDGESWSRGVWADHLASIVRRWLNANDLPFDEIWRDWGKPLADVYIDDRAVACRPTDYDEEYNKDEVFYETLASAKGIMQTSELGNQETKQQ